MALSARTRTWLQAAPADALAQLQQEVEQLASALAHVRAAAEEKESTAAHRDGALQGEIDSLREDIAALRAEAGSLRNGLSSLAERVEVHVAQPYARTEDLADLQQALAEHGTGAAEIGARIAGLAEQWRWERDDLRKAVAAAVEQMRRPG